MRNVVQQYCKQLKHELRCPKENGMEFLNKTKKAIQEILIDNPKATLSEIENLLGTPHELAQTYLAHIDRELLQKYRHRRKSLIRLLICFALLVTIALSILMVLKWEAEHAVIEVETTITEIS